MKHEHQLEAYLEATKYVDYEDPQIQLLIASFNQRDEMDRVRAAFEYVRDHIDHSYDIQNREVTRTASDVIKKGHGICYAKSHLLAAILRGMGVPSGFSYQRLTLFDTPEQGHCIHALNTVYLQELGKWIRLDSRGNKKGLNAQFSIEEEKLAFPIREHYGERDYDVNYSQPPSAIIETLENHSDSKEMYFDLPNKL